MKCRNILTKEEKNGSICEFEFELVRKFKSFSE